VSAAALSRNLVHIFAAWLLMTVVGGGIVHAEFDETATLIIRNVTLIDSEAETDDATVDIRIEKGRLDLVSRDEIPAREGEVVVDAEGGFVIGTLVLSRPPSFLVLDEDPRVHFEVLLDTEEHIVFAIRDGVVVLNSLSAPAPAAAAPEEEAPERRSRWFAYTPPPIALPIDYQTGAKWNAWQGKVISGIVLGAVVLDRTHWLSQDGASRQQTERITGEPGGELSDFGGGEIRGFRAGVGGTINFKRPWIYAIAGATNAFGKGFDREEDDDFTFFDYRLDIPLGSAMSLSLGNQKEPISLERLTGMVYLPWQERSAVADALAPSRNFGAVLSGTALEQRMTWAGGVFNNSLITGGSDTSATQLIGRVTGLPYLSADESQLVHLGLGVRHTDAEEGLRYFTEPEINQSPVFVDTGFFAANSATLYNLEASWRGGPFWIMGEYFQQEVAATAVGDPTFGGFYLSANWVISGEMRAYNKRSGILERTRVAQSVYQGGRGAWEAAIRYSSLDLSDGAIEGGELDILSLGVNWWLSGTFSLGLNVRHIMLDRYDLSGSSDAANLRVLLVLE
jgi:phosphate-selective porin OprO/OprP